MLRESIRPKACARLSCARRPSHGGRLAATAVLIAALAGTSTAQAAPWPADAYNPKPAADDVILPMPCDGAMAFRRVVIPADGPLGDRLVFVGGTDSEHGYAESLRPTHIAGSFTGKGSERSYLLGKYEVTRQQYKAVAGPCPTPAADLALPQTDVAWIDAVNFGDRYSLWLRQNAADKLPKEGDETGFVRLPTEDEWDFAARGGIGVSDSEFRERVFPMPDGMAAYAWFAGSESANGKVQRIGLLKPNPLGLHDILGNVDEIVLDPFRLNRLDRLHGQAGGFVVRGGNFRTAEDDMRTAYRHEIPYYKGGEPRRAATTGFRMALVAPVITSPDRLKAIEDAWGKLGAEAKADAPPAAAPKEDAKSTPKVPTLGSKPLDDPVQELGAIADAATDANMQTRLKNLQLAFRASFQARDDQRDRAAKARLRLGTFLCQKLHDDGVPIDRLKDVLKACIEARGADNERCRGQKAMIDDEEAKQWSNLRYYADTIVSLDEDYGASVLDRQMAVLKAELTAGGLQELVSVADIYGRHAAGYRKQQTIDRATWLAECKKAG
ncbi:MAG: SUMF1/EgtB/PvdO family nonheme iron enzyme [Rhodospirillales bacterium]